MTVFIYFQVKDVLVSQYIIYTFYCICICDYFYVHFNSYYNLFIECQCNTTGSSNNICDHITGQCNCRSNVNGNQCDTCNVSMMTYY